MCKHELVSAQQAIASIKLQRVHNALVKHKSKAKIHMPRASVEADKVAENKARVQTQREGLSEWIACLCTFHRRPRSTAARTAIAS